MKTNIRVFVSLLVLAAMLVSMPISALAMDDNPEDSVDQMMNSIQNI